VRVKVFSVQSTNRKPRFDDLETKVNQWLADHPETVVENTVPIGQPNLGWGHVAIAVWYTER